MDDFDFTQNYRDKWIDGFYVVRYGFFEDKDNYAFHRLDGPACVYRDGREDYFVGDERHRIDGPAIYVPHNEKENRYYQLGLRHRVDGPAAWLCHYAPSFQDDEFTPRYYLRGHSVSREQFEMNYLITHLKVYEGE